MERWWQCWWWWWSFPVWKNAVNTRWRLNGDPTLDEREHDYMATFVMQNVETDKNISVSLTQTRGGPATDLIGALRAAAIMLERTATEPSDPASLN